MSEKAEKIKNKAKALKALATCEHFVLITDEDAFVNMDFSGLTGVMMAHAIKTTSKQLNDVLKDFQGESNGRNKRGRKSSSRNKQA